jgi:hypothetical protein
VQVELYLKQMHDFIFGQRPSMQPYRQSTGICILNVFSMETINTTPCGPSPWKTAMILLKETHGI